MDEHTQWKGKGAAPFLSFNRLTQARLTRSMNRESQLAQGEGRRRRCRRRPGEYNRTSTRNGGFFFLWYIRFTKPRVSRSMNEGAQTAWGRRWWRCRRRPGDHNRSSTRNSGHSKKLRETSIQSTRGVETLAKHYHTIPIQWLPYDTYRMDLFFLQTWIA